MDKIQGLSWLPTWFPLTVRVEKKWLQLSAVMSFQWQNLDGRTRKKGVGVGSWEGTSILFRFSQQHLDSVSSPVFCPLQFGRPTRSVLICTVAFLFSFQCPLWFWLPPFGAECFRCCGKLSVCLGFCPFSSNVDAVVSPGLNITLNGRDRCTQLI